MFSILVDATLATLLFVGDSTMRSIAANPLTHYHPNMVFGNESVVFFGIAGVNIHRCGPMPSDCTAQAILRDPGLKSEAARLKVRAVYLNFAGLHLLHMFPHRPWMLHHNLTKNAAQSLKMAGEHLMENCSKTSQLCYFSDFRGTPWGIEPRKQHIGYRTRVFHVAYMWHFAYALPLP